MSEIPPTHTLRSQPMRRTDILSKELVQKFQALGITGFHGIPTKGPRKGHKDVP